MYGKNAMKKKKEKYKKIKEKKQYTYKE